MSVVFLACGILCSIIDIVRAMLAMFSNLLFTGSDLGTLGKQVIVSSHAQNDFFQSLANKGKFLNVTTVICSLIFHLHTKKCIYHLPYLKNVDSYPKLHWRRLASLHSSHCKIKAANALVKGNFPLTQGNTATNPKGLFRSMLP